VVVLGLLVAVPGTAQDDLVFADFDSVEAWQGFELSREQARSGDTSALWREMPATPRVSSSEIPHDW